MQTLPPDRQKKPSTPASTPLAQSNLADAFASFTQTAAALETTYAKLQTEVTRLRRELEDKNRSLAKSLEENRRIQSYLGQILEDLPCGVLVFDAETRLRLINPAALRLLNEDTEVATSQDTFIPKLLGPLLAARPPGTGEQEWEVKGGTIERTLGVTRARLRTQNPWDDSILILRDLTGAKQFERAREQARRSQALAEVSTLLAHEIRNPLGSLELFAGLLADALCEQTELYGWVSHIQAGLRSLAATVNNVLQFHSQPAAKLLPVDLRRLLGDTAEFLRPLATQKGMEIVCKAKHPSIAILADSSRLQQAFLNLALNAFRAMKPGGTLTISVSAGAGDKSDTCTVAFADEGTGISAEQVDEIFEPGFTTQTGRPGLGLAVTRKIVEQHCGHIRVESHGSNGSTFMLTFPRLIAEKG